jgi:DUF1009 family protein
MLKMLWNLPRRNTDALIGGVADELAGEGIELIDSTYFLQDHLAAKGALTKRKPSEIELGNIEYGLHIADEIARLDLGQTIVVRAKACVAIEAMEGTDATIRRAGELAKGKLTGRKSREAGSGHAIRCSGRRHSDDRDDDRRRCDLPFGNRRQDTDLRSRPNDRPRGQELDRDNRVLVETIPLRIP